MVRFLITAVVAAILVGITPQAIEAEKQIQAKRIHEVESSTVYQELRQGTKRSKGWLRDGSNYSKIFKGKNGGHVLFKWLGEPPRRFKKTGGSAAQTRDYSRATKKFSFGKLSNKEDKVVTVTILVPKPHVAAAVDLGLINDFSSYEPPKLPVETAEAIDVRGLEGQLYIKRQKLGCSLLLKLERSSIMNFHVDRCEFTKDMFELVYGLNIHRLNTKLQT